MRLATRSSELRVSTARTRSAMAVVVLVALGCQDPVSNRPSPDSPPVNPSVAADARANERASIPDQYIVVFADDLTGDDEVERLRVKYRGVLLHRYEVALNGFALRMPDALAELLRAEPGIALVEQDQLARAATTQTGATWGLDRIDQRNRPLDGGYTYGPTGADVRAYILDSGILLSHSEFAGGRATLGVDLVGASTCTPVHGHGSHVAGTVGGTTYGVAKQVRLIDVRVLPCDLTQPVSTIIAGVDWVAANAVKPAVANMSISVPKSDAMDLSVANSVAKGIVFVVAAGNNRDDGPGVSFDACNYSPGRAPSAITVASSDADDRFSSFSNGGPCVDVTAPGRDVVSAWNYNTTMSSAESGTSMASPHVAGAAALYLSLNPTATPAQVAAALVTNGTPGVLTNAPSGMTTANRLLYTGFMSGTTPVATVTVTLAQSTLVAGSTTQATARDANGTDITGSVTWSSSKSSTATVSSSGVVTAVKPGSATITATRSGVSGSAIVNVKKK